jgi:AraC family transcriptional activator of pobA
MSPKTKVIPVHSLPESSVGGIVIGQMSGNDLPVEEVSHSHRHDFHFFVIQEKGTTTLEIDFKKYKLKESSIVYLHPNQVHRFLQTNNTRICGLLMNNENLNPEYLPLLEEIVPAQPLVVKKEDFARLNDTARLCIKAFERTSEVLYHALLKDNCNALVALFLIHYLERAQPADKLSRYEVVTKSFKALLERHFTTAKSPSDYAQLLNISVPYLNECVKHATGKPVSWHIQQRVVLEAKRLLFHSDSSVKEIASRLGYQDYAYFSRLFTKVAGMTALTFRNKNRD